MNSITQDIKYRLSILSYTEKNGVTKAAIKYCTNRQFIYRLKWRYDGTSESLQPKSRRPHHHPNQHTPAEIKLIKDMRRRNPNAGLVVFWVKLKLHGYARSITGLYRCLKRMGLKKEPLPTPNIFLNRIKKLHSLVKKYRSTLKLFPPPASLVMRRLVAKRCINIPLLMNVLDFAILRHSKNRAPIPL